MSALLRFYRSTIGKKIIMAVTGVIWIGFLIAHMLGNLQAFAGADRLNAYGVMLREQLGSLLWLQRAGLAVALVLHVTMAIQLTRISRAARPVGYDKVTPQAATLASRTMLVGGIILGVFLILHILHFTTLHLDPAGYRGVLDAQGRPDVYGNVVASFRTGWVAALYLLALGAVGLHLMHGAWSAFRTMGHAPRAEHPFKRRVAYAVALAVWVGFIVVPIAVLAGVIR